MELPQSPHCALIVGATECGKTEFILDLLETYYRGVFENIIILCPSIGYNKTYRGRSWIWNSPNVLIIEKCQMLHKWLSALYDIYKGTPTLYIIDDMASSAALSEKNNTLSYLAMSGRHALQSTWILSQAYTSVLKDFRRQTKWVALFDPKDRDSFNECLRENDIVPAEAIADIRAKLANKLHSKLILKTEKPAKYGVY